MRRSPTPKSAIRVSVAIHWLLLAVLGFGIAAAFYCAARGGTGSDPPAATPAAPRRANPYCRRDAALIALDLVPDADSAADL